MAAESHSNLFDRGSSKKQVESIQALRWFAALGVVLYHFQAQNSPGERFYTLYKTPLHILGVFGFFGVSLFFVISGFVMVVTSWDSFGVPGARRAFLQRRIVRIYPAYWFALAPVAAAFLLDPHGLMPRHASQHVDLLASLFLLPNGDDVMLLIVSWTLVWEMIFYSTFTLLLGISRSYLLRALAIWLLAEALLTFLCHPSSNAYVRYFGELFPVEFIMGAFVGWLYIHRRLACALPALCAGLAGSAYLWASKLVAGLPAPPEFRSEIVVLGLIATLIVFGSAGLEQQGRLKTPPFLARLGDSSYAMYLWHLQVMTLVGITLTRLHFTGWLGQAVGIIGTIVVLTMLSVAIYRYVERPLNKSLNGLLDRAFAKVTPRPTDGAAIVPQPDEGSRRGLAFQLDWSNHGNVQDRTPSKRRRERERTRQGQSLRLWLGARWKRAAGLEHADPGSARFHPQPPE